MMDNQKMYDGLQSHLTTHQPSVTFSFQRELSPWLRQSSYLPTRLLSTEQRNIAWRCSEINQVLLQTHTFKGSFRTEFFPTTRVISIKYIDISKDSFDE